ncbi:uncharacterized protein LOC124550812 [Schistocerca americana]|uniref:uncharacterized protein LOC124550812 n=1 Tax=Schistocerca americana TaxID=7009 RepID=UPI001F4FF3F8|nr:uncharacterized protein LOC124550812 [Schistocerca americana]
MGVVDACVTANTSLSSLGEALLKFQQISKSNTIGHTKCKCLNAQGGITKYHDEYKLQLNDCKNKIKELKEELEARLNQIQDNISIAADLSQINERMTCTECNTFRCSRRQELIHHLECVHQRKMECKEMTFNSVEEFFLWKEQMETEEKVSFIRPSGKKKCDYFVCHRSVYADKTASGRRLNEPSIKIGGTCPTCLVVKNLSSNVVNVKLYMTHTGHSLSVGSLHLTTADRAMVAELIAQGVPDTTILKKVRGNIQVGLFRTVHLLSKQDIRNIRKEYKLDYSAAHPDGATIVEL